MKDELRYKYKIKRKYFQHSRREVADGAIFDAAVACLGGYDDFFIYYSFGSEADTHRLIDALLGLGKRVSLPRVEGDGMSAVPYRRGDVLRRGAFGVPEPAGQACGGDIEVVIVPLLAVNSSGYRLGYGGGYYDRWLADLQGLTVCICPEERLVDELPREGFDVPVQLVLS